MAEERNKKWLDWAREIQSIAQIGNTYAVNEFQMERYSRLIEIAAEITHEHTDFPIDPILSVFHKQTGYATPKIDVRGAVFRDSKLLMVRERMDGRWTLPGGWVDVCETPAASAEREVLEESGFLVKATKLIGVYDANRIEPFEFFHAFKLLFLCELHGGEAKISNETTEVRFFDKCEFPLDFSGERTRLRHILDAYKSLNDPDCLTVFD